MRLLPNALASVANRPPDSIGGKRSAGMRERNRYQRICHTWVLDHLLLWLLSALGSVTNVCLQCRGDRGTERPAPLSRFATANEMGRQDSANTSNNWGCRIAGTVASMQLCSMMSHADGDSTVRW